MKVVIEVDPVEARQLMGLPDVQPLQNAVMKKIEEKVMAQAEKFSGEGILTTWFSGQGTKVFSDVIGGFLSQGGAKDKRDGPPKGGTKE